MILRPDNTRRASSRPPTAAARGEAVAALAPAKLHLPSFRADWQPLFAPISNALLVRPTANRQMHCTIRLFDFRAFIVCLLSLHSIRVWPCRIAQTNSLRLLDLSNTTFGDAGCAALAHGWRAALALEHLDLRNACVSDVGVAQMCTLLKQPASQMRVLLLGSYRHSLRPQSEKNQPHAVYNVRVCVCVCVCVLECGACFSISVFWVVQVCVHCLTMLIFPVVFLRKQNALLMLAAQLSGHRSITFHALNPSLLLESSSASARALATSPTPLTLPLPLRSDAFSFASPAHSKQQQQQRPTHASSPLSTAATHDAHAQNASVAYAQSTALALLMSHLPPSHAASPHANSVSFSATAASSSSSKTGAHGSGSGSGSGSGVGAHAAGQLRGVFSADVDEATLASVARVSTAVTAGALVASSSSSTSSSFASSSSAAATALPAQAFESATRNRLTAVGVELLLSALLAGAYERYAAAQPSRPAAGAAPSSSTAAMHASASQSTLPVAGGTAAFAVSVSSVYPNANMYAGCLGFHISVCSLLLV